MGATVSLNPASSLYYTTSIPDMSHSVPSLSIYVTSNVVTISFTSITRSNNDHNGIRKLDNVDEGCREFF